MVNQKTDVKINAELAEAMNISIKTVTSPFSFFCVAEDENNNNYKIEKEMLLEFENPKSNRMNITDINHGQYVAVLWKHKWVRGIISMEVNFLIWLIDHGVFIRPSEDTVYVNLPAEYKNLPSKVFEASVHGVVPVCLEMDDMYKFKKKTSLTWNLGAIAKAEEFIASAKNTFFVPVALLTTKTNDVVIGDLYLEIDGKMVNFVDEMCSRGDSPMHMYMDRNQEFYIESLAKLYPNRRLHRACLLKPELPIKSLPVITTEITVAEYSAICDEVEQLHIEEDSNTDSVGGSSVTYIESHSNAPPLQLKLTQHEIEQYSNQFIVVSGREYNVLTVIINKARDLYICEKYKDAKSVGRATTRLRGLPLE